MGTIETYRLQQLKASVECAGAGLAVVSDEPLGEAEAGLALAPLLGVLALAGLILTVAFLVLGPG